MGDVQRWRRQSIRLNRATLKGENTDILRRCINSLTWDILVIKMLLLMDKHVAQNQRILKAMGLFCTEDTEALPFAAGQSYQLYVILML